VEREQGDLDAQPNQQQRRDDDLRMRFHPRTVQGGEAVQVSRAGRLNEREDTHQHEGGTQNGVEHEAP